MRTVASSFGTYSWGTPEDEPLQPLARSRWAVRNAVPLAPPGNIRMLDSVEEIDARSAQEMPTKNSQPMSTTAKARSVLV